MKKKVVYMIALCFFALWTGCSIKEGFIDKDCPPGPGPGPGTDKETLKIVFDWGDSQQVSPDQPINLMITDSDKKDSLLTSGPQGVTVQLDPDTYQVTGYENAENVTVADEVVTVATLADGTAAEPGAFTGGTVTAQVKADVEDQTIVVPMRWQTRELIVRVLFLGEGVPDLVDTEGYLSGATLSRPINEGFAPLDGQPRHAAITSGSITCPFTKTADGWYQASRHLLGLDGDADQRLYVKLIFTDGFMKDLNYDAKDALLEFHTYRVDEPWVLEFVLNLGTGFEVEVVDWSSGPSSVIIAD